MCVALPAGWAACVHWGLRFRVKGQPYTYIYIYMYMYMYFHIYHVYIYIYVCIYLTCLAKC